MKLPSFYQAIHDNSGIKTAKQTVGSSVSRLVDKASTVTKKDLKPPYTDVLCLASTALPRMEKAVDQNVAIFLSVDFSITKRQTAGVLPSVQTPRQNTL